MFAYSMREKTYAWYHYTDDVQEAVKKRRLQEVITTFYDSVEARNRRLEVGREDVVVLVEHPGRLSTDGVSQMVGRSDNNKKVVLSSASADVSEPVTVGDYFRVRIEDSRGSTLHGVAVEKLSLDHLTAPS